MGRAGFDQTDFKNCTFVNVNLRSSDIFDCKFETTKFSKSQLDLIAFRRVKILKSDEWVDIDNSSIFRDDLPVYTRVKILKSDDWVDIDNFSTFKEEYYK